MSSKPANTTVEGGAAETRVTPGRLIVITSPSGGGKGTLIQRLLQRMPDLGYSISFTTRQPRAGEKHGREYFFVTVEEFLTMRDADDFIESAVVHGNHYGTARSQIARELATGRDLVVEIDVQGAALLRAADPNALTIFILPPSYAVLAARLWARRAEQPVELARRLRNSRDEVARFHEFHYVIINDDLDEATVRLTAIVVADRERLERQEDTAQRVLDTFAGIG
jgi:guanylate kinase